MKNSRSSSRGQKESSTANRRHQASHSSQGRGWYGHHRAHSEAAMKGWEHRGDSYGAGNSRNSGGRDYNGWSDDFDRHSSSGRRWANQYGSLSDRGDNYSGRSENSRGSFRYDQPSRDWDNRENSRSDYDYGYDNRRETRGDYHRDDNYDSDNYSGRGQGHGWYGDSDGHSQASQRGWEDRDGHSRDRDYDSESYNGRGRNSGSYESYDYNESGDEDYGNRRGGRY